MNPTLHIKITFMLYIYIYIIYVTEINNVPLIMGAFKLAKLLAKQLNMIGFYL